MHNKSSKNAVDIVDCHGGTLTAESIGAGKGATFKITFPTEDQMEKSFEHPKGASENARDQSSSAGRLAEITVLVVEDDPDIQALMTTVLEMQDARVLLVGDSAQALQVIESGEVDMVLCDIGLPGEDGYSLVKKMLKILSDNSWRIPVYALTAFAGKEHEDRALAAGFTGYVSKPIRISELVEVIFEAVRFGRAGETIVNANIETKAQPLGESAGDSLL